MKSLIVLAAFTAIMTTNSSFAKFVEPPPPPVKAYSTVPPYNYFDSAKRQYYGGMKPGYVYCSSGCDARSEAYRDQYEIYQEFKANKEMEQYIAPEDLQKYREHKIQKSVVESQ